MKTAMYAIIKKDFRGVASNRRLFSALLIVPLVPVSYTHLEENIEPFCI